MFVVAWRALVVGGLLWWPAWGSDIIDMVVAVACAFSSLAFWRCVPVQCVGGRGPLTAGALWAPRLRLYLTLFDTNELIIYSIALSCFLIQQLAKFSISNLFCDIWNILITIITLSLNRTRLPQLF